jgi:hypothetical protein
VQQLGEDLASLHGIRKEADYRMDTTLSEDDAQGAIDDAEAFFRCVSTISPADIGRAMKDDIERTFK